MREKLVLLSLIFLIGCSSAPKNADHQMANPSALPTLADKEVPVKEFARGELIIATDLLVKIFDKEMGPVACVPDHDEAELLLRTIRPRMEVVEDDVTALLDDKAEVKKLIMTCETSCTCGYVDDLLREHMVPLTRAEKEMMAKKRTPQEINRCLTYAQTTFCQGELYKTLNAEKKDFSFDDEGSL